MLLLVTGNMCVNIYEKNEIPSAEQSDWLSLFSLGNECYHVEEEEYYSDEEECYFDDDDLFFEEMDARLFDELPFKEQPLDEEPLAEQQPVVWPQRFCIGCGGSGYPFSAVEKTLCAMWIDYGIWNPIFSEIHRTIVRFNIEARENKKLQKRFSKVANEIEICIRHFYFLCASNDEKWRSEIFNELVHLNVRAAQL